MDRFSFLFGEALKVSRRRRNITQQQLAAKLGVHRNTIGGWERGDYLPESAGMVLELAKLLLLDDQETRHLLEASLTALSPHWSVPYLRNPFFTGRENLLQKLHEQLQSGKEVTITQSYALQGLGGIGKTQIALEYAYRYAHAYTATFWIGAETTESINASFLRIAKQLGQPERQEIEQANIVAAVQRWLANHRDWLLIWDNVEDFSLLQRFSPPARVGSLLLTTRRQALGTLAQGIELPTMEPEEGICFLLRRAKLLPPTVSDKQEYQLAQELPREYTIARQLVEEMGGLPLALDQVGAYVEETPCRLEDYLELYRLRRATLLKRRGDAAVDHPASVVTTWSLAFEQVERTNAAAADLLRLCAFLHPDAIPEELFLKGAALLSEHLEPVVADGFLLHEAFQAVTAYSLLKRNVEERTLTMHRLVQAVLWEEMSEQERGLWRMRTIHLLHAAFPEVTYAIWPQCERLLPHVLTTAAATPDDAGDQELADILRKAADYLRARAQMKQSEALYQRALRILEQTVGSEHPAIVAVLQGLARLYDAQGKAEQAELLYQRALNIQEQALGTEHTQVAALLRHLARLYFGQGKYEQAEALYQRSLHIFEQAVGPGHIQVAPPLGELANVYYEQGKYEQAEPLYQRALDIHKQALGPEHPNVALSQNNLARLFVKQGKYQQAELLYQQALHTWEQTLGPDHPNVAAGYINLAELYREQGKYEQAEPLCLRALHTWEQALGSDHPDIAFVLDELARIYSEQGKYKQAEPLYQRALTIQEQVQGKHPETAQTLHDLALCFQKQGNLAKAASLYKRALEIRARFLGDSHPDTIATHAQYAAITGE